MKSLLRATLLSSLLAVVFIGHSQVYVSNYHPDEGNPNGINTEGDAPGFGSWNTVIDGSLAANEWSSSVAIPFTFEFFGQTVTHLRMSGNGLVTFDTLSTVSGTPPNANTALPTNTLPDQTIACFWDEFTTSPPTGSNDEAGWQVFGTAPNRQLWLKWYSYEWGALSFNYAAVVLEESSNSVYIVDQYSSAPGSMASTVGIQESSTSAISVGSSVQLSGNGTSINDNDFYSFTLLDSLDAGVTDVINPSAGLCPGTINVEVEVTNFGFANLDSLNIGLVINGAPPVTFNFGGLGLDTLEKDTLSLGNFTFTAGVVYDIDIYTFDPNGAPDQNNINDTVSFVNAQTGLAGNFTIDGGTPTGGTNYQTFADAAQALNTLGVCGPIVFDVFAGTFTESVTLTNVVGVSSTNTVTFDGAGVGNTILTHDASGDEATFRLDGTSWVTVKNMTVQTTSTSADAWCIHLSNASNNVSIDSCAFEMNETSTTDIGGVVASNSLTTETSEGDNANFLTITNSSFDGGEFGVHLEGLNATYSQGNTISNCYFKNHDDHAIEVDNMENLTIVGNTIDSITTSGGDGIYLVDVDGFEISANTVTVADYGIYVEDGNDAFVPPGPSRVVNNMVISTGDFAIYLNDFEITQVYHNTVNGDAVGIRINDHLDVDIRNNIMYSLGGQAFASLDALGTAAVIDNNYYYSEATNEFNIGGTNYPSLAAWITAEPAFNSTSVSADPLFVDAASDLHLVNDFAAYNQAVDVSVNVDVDGEVRPQDGGFDIGADEFNLGSLPALDLSVLQVTSPSGLVCAGSQDIFLRVLNSGNTTIDSVNILFSVNGSPAANIPVGGLNITSGTFDTLNLGAFNFQFGVVYDFVLYSNSPNGGVDNVLTNDTLEINGIQASLFGTYTIDGATPTGGTNFQTFSDAAQALNTVGVCGPVVFDVLAGTYTESIILLNVPGVSSVNTVTFDGAGVGNSILTHDATGDEATFQIDGTDYITIKNLTIQTTSTSADAWCLHLSGAADHITVDSCAFEMNETTTTDIGGIVASNSLTFETSEADNANFLTVSNSSFDGGEFGIHLEGANATYSVGNTITNCTFKNHDDHAIEVDNMEELTITGNFIDSITTTAGDGIFLTDVDGYDVSGNTVITEDWGIYITDGNDLFTPQVVSKVNNNIVISTGDFAIYLNDFESTQVYHNSTNGDAVGIRINDQTDLDLRNNIMYSITGKAFESLDALTTNDTVDYNYYYSEATNAFTVGGTNYGDLAAWVAAEPDYNANSVEGEPAFVDPASDLRLDNDFLAYNAGLDLGVAEDIDGEARPQDGGFDIGADEYPLTLPPLDLELSQIVAPTGGICPGTENVLIEVQNNGIATITSANIVLTVNGGTPTTIPFTGLDIVTGEFDTLDLGAFTFAAGVVYDIELYSTMPNGGNDTTTSNDTIEIMGLQTGLVGTYTIDGATPTGGTNYQTFSDAALALNSFGVCGAVVFNVQPGTYNESVALTDVFGVSGVNTITFDGDDASLATLTHDGTNNATFGLNGTGHVTLKNLTIETTSSSADAWCVHLRNASDSVTVDSCNIIMPIAATADVQGVVASNSLTAETSEGNNANFLTVSNSYFEGGETGVHLEGAASPNYNEGSSIVNNVFRFHDDEAINVDKQLGLDIMDNDVDSLDSGTDGFFLTDIDDYHIEANNIIVDDWALYVLDGNDGFTPSTPSTVINNMIISSADYGIYLNDFEETEVFHNSVVGVPAIRINDQINLDARNNIFIGVGDFAFESDDILTTNDTVDYNIYDSDNTNMFDISVTTYVDLAAWQAGATGYNANSLEGTPLFVAPNDLHVLDPLALNVGDNSVGVGFDIDGEARPIGAGVDIGADEYIPLANDLASINVLGLTGQICAEDSFFFEIVVFNGGTSTQTQVPLSIDFTGGITSTLLDTVPSINGFEFDTLLVGPLSTLPGGLINGQLVTLLTGDENNENDTLEFSFDVSPLPALPTAMDDTVCFNDTASLIALTGESTFLWYETEFSANPIFTGDTFEIANVTGDTTVWMSTSGGQSASGGPVDNTIGAGGNFANTTIQYMEFDALTTIILDSVRIYPNGAGNVEIVLQDNNGTLLQSVVVPASGTAGEMIPVGFVINAGSYRLLGGAGTTTGGLYRNSTGASYPYAVGALANITGNSFDPVYYYYYYDWRVSAAGCESERIAVNVSVDTVTVDLGIDTTICAEDSVTLDAGAGYASYLWPDNSTNQTFETGAGTIMVTVTNDNNCPATDEVVISNHAAPVVNLGNDTAFCDGNTITLDAGSFDTYEWQDASTNQTLDVSMTGQYIVTVTDANTCEGSDTVEVTVNALPVVDLGGDLSYCADDTDFNSTLDAGAGFTAYVWNTADSSQIINVDSAGTFDVTVTDANGCQGSDEVTVSELALPSFDAGSDTSICEGETINLATTSGNLTLSWTDSTGTSVSSVTEPGVYVATGTDTNGCSSTDTIVVGNCVGINGVTETRFAVYPNPAQDVVFVQFEDVSGIENVQLFDGLGNLVIDTQVSGQDRIEIDLRGIAAGYYFVKVVGSDATGTSRIVVQ